MPLERVRSHGYVPDDPGHVVTHVRHLLDRIGAPQRTPPAVDFAWADQIEDQSISESCVSWRIKCAIETLFRRLGNPLPPLSGYSLWTWTRMIDSPGAPLLNVGCSPSVAFRALHEWGIATREAWPEYPATMNDSPTLEKRCFALGFKFDGDYTIAADSRAEMVDLLRRTLTALVPVTFAIHDGPAFSAYRGGLYMPEDGAPNHYVGLSGYRTESDGSTTFRLVNQWGKMWGDGGYAWVPESAVDGWEAIRALDVRRTA